MVSWKSTPGVNERTKTSLPVVHIMSMYGIGNAYHKCRKDPSASNDRYGNVSRRVPAQYQDQKGVDRDGLARKIM